MNSIDKVISLKLFNDNKEITNFISYCHSLKFKHKKEFINLFLHPNEINYYNSIKRNKRKDSYILGRYAGKLVLSEFYRETVKSRIEIFSGVFQQPITRYNSELIPEISITHTCHVALAIVTEAGYNVAIDFEQEKDDWWEKYNIGIKSEEMVYFQTLEIRESQIALIIWTSKEALSKAIKTGLTSDIHIFSINNIRQLTTEIYLVEFEFFKNIINYAFIVGNHILSICLPRKLYFNIEDTNLHCFIDELKESFVPRITTGYKNVN